MHGNQTVQRRERGRARLRPINLALVTALLAMALVVGACGGDDEQSTGGGGATVDGGAETREVKLLLSLRMSGKWLSGLVAEKHGYFADEGIKVEFQQTDGSSFVTQQLIAGNSDFGFAGAASDLIAFEKATNLRALACNEAQSVFSINVTASSGITDVAGLAGKTIGIAEKGGGEDPMLQSVLAEYDLKDSVKVQPLGDPGPAVVRALQDDKVVGFVSGYTDIATLEAGGVDLVDITPDKYKPMPGDCLVTTSDVLEDPEKQEIAAGLVRAWTKGAYFAMANPDAALEIVCEKIPEQCTDRENFTKPYVERIVGLLQPGDTSLPPSALDPQGWATSAEVLQSAGILEGEVDVNTLIGAPEVKAVQDAAYADLEQLKADAEADASGS